MLFFDATVPRLFTRVNVTLTFRGGPASAATTATSPIFTPSLTTVYVTVVLTVLLEVHQ
jgi:hypothetical protein